MSIGAHKGRVTGALLAAVHATAGTGSDETGTQINPIPSAESDTTWLLSFPGTVAAHPDYRNEHYHMPQPNIHVRHATAADNTLLAEIGAETFRDTFAADNTPGNMAAYLAASFGPDKQAAELADPSSVFLIAEIECAAVGYARLREGQPPKDITGARPIEIARLYARKKWIGRGVGAVLMQACLEHADTRHCDTIWLDVWERNDRARAFYGKWGFVQVGTQTFQLGDDLQNDLLLQRSVKTPQPDSVSRLSRGNDVG